MHIDLQELKKYNDNTEFLEGLVHSYCTEPEDKDSIAYNTLSNLNFLKSGYFDLGIIEAYDSGLLTTVLEILLNEFIWLVDRDDDGFSLEDYENQSEEEYLESVEKNDTANNVLDENSVYYKTFKNNNLITKKKDKYTFNVKILDDLDTDSLNRYVSESITMISSEGAEYNEVVTNSLKKLEIIK